MAACSVCHLELSPAQVLYNEQAAIVCQKCHDAYEVKASHARSADTARAAAYGNIALGVTSLVFNPFFFFSFATFANLAFVFRRTAEDQRRGLVIRDADTRKVVATVGAVIGAIAVVLRFV
jgi:hypothetical protein